MLFGIRKRARSVGTRTLSLEGQLEMSEQATSDHEDFRTVLWKQQQRVVAAVAAEEATDATPILQDGEALSSEEYVTLVYELHHVHLPELQAAGVIEFDRREETVRRGPCFNEGQSLFKHGHDR
mgnify:FL=1